MLILEEFDPDSPAVIDPFRICRPEADFPDTAISCFTSDMYRELLVNICEESAEAAFFTSGMSRPVHTAYYKGKKLALYLSPVGAPACAAALEDVYAMGVQTVILFGTCGVLDRTIPDGSVIIPDSALRDEGTSYHYAPPSDIIQVNPDYTEVFRNLLDQKGIPHRTGRVWTTDAVYRETRDKVKRRKNQGCLCADMECSALAAVSQFRKRGLFQFFYAADNLDADSWEARSLPSGKNRSRKAEIAELAAELSLLIAEK